MVNTPTGGAPDFLPFGDDAASRSIGGLTVENGSMAIAVYGQADLPRDQAGLAGARALLALFQSIVQVLEADPTLPLKAAPPAAHKAVKNPFA